MNSLVNILTTIIQTPSATVHEVADTVGVIVSLPFLGIGIRIVWLMSQIKTELKATVDALKLTTEDHEERIRPMESRVEILWDGRDRREIDRRKQPKGD